MSSRDYFDQYYYNVNWVCFHVCTILSVYKININTTWEYLQTFYQTYVQHAYGTRYQLWLSVWGIYLLKIRFTWGIRFVDIFYKKHILSSDSRKIVPSIYLQFSVLGGVSLSLIPRSRLNSVVIVLFSNVDKNVDCTWSWLVYLTIIPWARMGSESIAHEGERNNCFSKIQLVGKQYRDKTTLASKTRFSRHCFGFQSRRFSLLVGYNI